MHPYRIVFEPTAPAPRDETCGLRTAFAVLAGVSFVQVTTATAHEAPIDLQAAVGLGCFLIGVSGVIRMSRSARAP